MPSSPNRRASARCDTHPERRRWLQLLAVALLALCAQLAAATTPCAPLSLHAAAGITSTVRIDTGLQWLSDPAGTLTIAEVATAAFTPLPRATVPARNDAAIWVRLCLHRQADAAEQWLLSMIPANRHSVVLYSPDPDAPAGFARREQGIGLPFAERDFPYRGFAFALALESVEPQVFYLRLGASNNIATYLSLQQPANLAAAIGLGYGVFGFYFGMTLLVALINAMFWFWLRDPVYIQYSAAITATVVFAAFSNGYVSQFLLPDSPELALLLQRTSFALAALLLTRFVATAFQLRVFYPWVHRVNEVFFACYLVLLVGCVLDILPALMDGLRLLIRFHIAMIMVVLLHALVRRPELRLYVVAFLPLALSLLAIVLQSMGVPLERLRLDQLPHWGSLAHIVLLSAALARRAWRADHDKRAALAQALEISRESARTLERRVAERTRALDTTNTELVEEIAERTRVEQRLQLALAAERTALLAQRQFLEMMSHEFRTPLGTIRLSAERLARTLAPQSPEHARPLEKITRNALRMSRLIDNLLTRERLEAALQPLQRRKLDLGAHLHQLYHDTDARIRLQLPALPVAISADPQLLDIILSNLVNNALKYSGDAPVEIALTSAAAQAIITVRDYGPGIAAADRTRIFDKYYRHASTAALPGTGLGLHLAQELAHRHGGEIVYTAPAQPPGASFSLRLPLTAAAYAAPFVERRQPLR